MAIIAVNTPGWAPSDIRSLTDYRETLSLNVLYGIHT